MPIYALGEYQPQIHPDAWIMPEAVVIGRVTVGAKATFWSGAVLRADDNDIVIGEETSVQDNAVLHVTEEFPTVVGRRCTIGHLAHLEGCTIEDEALVGTGSIVLHEAVVGARALVGAGAVVPGQMRVPPGSMALGTPAKIREGVDTDPLILPGVETYIRRGQTFREQLRRID
ncbi:MAG: gamma carbonic anhydrase family protein [Acidimicrobiales bacterium]|nr:gamma carbonic anhydrase family protein [Acidimicrobiales bacterium]